MKNTPAYAIESVDNALQLAVLLQQEGPMRIADVAERLGVARSTAHRLFAMLVYRDFAEQLPDRRYRAGPVLRRAAVPEPTAVLRAIALPHLRELVGCTGESANLMVRVGDQVRFVATVESPQVLRVGDREGRVLPAHLASGGRALLATLTETEVAALYPAPLDLEPLLRLLRRVRRQGFAVNDRATEAGVAAVGRALRTPPGHPPTALSVALPTVRYTRGRLAELVGAVASVGAQLENDLVEWTS